MPHRGPDLDTDADDDDGSDGGDGGDGGGGDGGKGGSFVKKSAQQLAGEAVLSRLVTEVDGSAFSFQLVGGVD